MSDPYMLYMALIMARTASRKPGFVPKSLADRRYLQMEMG